MATSDKLLKDLKAKYGRSIPDVEDAGTIKRIVMSSPKLNYIFGGGFPVGRIVEFFGPESGGKSVVSSYIGGQIQNRMDGRKNNKVMYVDMEYTFEKNYARTAGLNLSTDLFSFIQPLNGEEGFTIVEDFVQTGEYGLIIWDSIATTPSSSVMVDEYGKASFGGTAKVFAEGLKKLNPYLARNETSLILINQIRAKIGGMSYDKEQTTGGYAPKFYASWRGKVSKVDDIMDKTEVIGNTIKVRNVKSKIGFPKRSAVLDLYYGTGFNPEAEYIDFIIDLGLVTKKGSWLSQDVWGYKGQGKPSLLEFLQNHKDIFEKCKQEVNDLFSKHSMLDDNEAPDPEAEEDLKVMDAVGEE